MKIATALLLLIAVTPVLAQDPLKSEACGAALAELQAARNARSNVEAVRSAAASACLGSAAVPGRPARVTQAPIVVPPPQIELAPRTLPLPSFSPPPPPVAIERAPGPALCDANGCWAPGDTHLRHVPPALAGPGGACMQQGGAVYCP